MTLQEINNFLKHENYYKDGVLINNPKPIFGQKEPFVSFLHDENKQVEYSVVMPVHNQENIITTNIESVINNMIGDYELIIILDNCTDNSENLLINYFSKFIFENSGLNRVILVNQPSPVFETTCDNIGFRLSNGKYIVEIQADMKIMTFGFNFILSKPFRIYDDIFSVSGRCAHNSPFDGSGVGKIGELVEKPLYFDFQYMNKLFIMNTCNRGPIIFLNNRIRELGYLDELNFVLGDDDHDINIRAFFKKNWICGHVPIEVYSPISLGSTRKEMDSSNKEYLIKRQSRRVNPFLYSVRHPKTELEIRDLEKKLNYR